MGFAVPLTLFVVTRFVRSALPADVRGCLEACNIEEARLQSSVHTIHYFRKGREAQQCLNLCFRAQRVRCVLGNEKRLVLVTVHVDEKATTARVRSRQLSCPGNLV